jgi:flagellar basal-body rod protein FlgG
MLEGLYTAASGMAAQQQRMDALANDVANVDTIGYKKTRVGFRDLVYQATGRGAANSVSAGAGVGTTQLGRSFQQGSDQNTGNPLDLALQGPGFLQVRMPNGQTALTRDGALHVNEAGALVDSRGNEVQPAVNLRDVPTSEISIGSDGSVSVNSQRVAQISIVEVRSPQALTSLGDNLYAANAASGAPQAATGTTVMGGATEASNVDMGDAMVDMMDAQRAYELASKAIHQQDEMMGIANGVKR